MKNINFSSVRLELFKNKNRRPVQANRMRYKVWSPSDAAMLLREACNHVPKRPNNEKVRQETGCAAAVKKLEHAVCHFLHGLVLSMEDSVGEEIAQTRASVCDHSSLVVEITRKVERKLQNIVFRQSILGNGSLDVKRVSPSRRVLLLPWIDVAPDCDFSRMPASDEVQATSPCYSK